MLADVDSLVGAEATRLAEPQIDAVDRDGPRAASLRNRHRMQTESAGAEHDQLIAIGKLRAVETPEHLRHRAVGRRCDRVGDVIRHPIKMLLGFYEVMRRESRGEMRRLVRMARANDLGGAGRMIPTDAIRASIADGVID